jgi:hypothetical protein
MGICKIRKQFKWFFGFLPCYQCGCLVTQHKKLVRNPQFENLRIWRHPLCNLHGKCKIKNSSSSASKCYKFSSYILRDKRIEMEAMLTRKITNNSTLYLEINQQQTNVNKLWVNLLKAITSLLWKEAHFLD